MTTTENRLLDLAERRGYLVCRRDQRTLVDQWSTWCQQQARPMLRVERQEPGWQLTVHWRTAPAPERLAQVRDLLKSAHPAPGLLPLVYPGGALSGYGEQAAIEALARDVVALLGA